VSDTGGGDLDRLLDPNLPHTFRGLDPEAVQGLLTDAVESLRAAQRREDELRTTIASLESELATARADATTELEQAKRRGREMVNEAQTVRRRILEDLVRRRRVLRRQIEQLRVGRERLLEAYEVVGQTVEEATSELGVSLVSATAAAERAGRRLGPDDGEVTEEELHAMEAEVDAARAAGLPIMDPPTAAERRAAGADADQGEEAEEDEDLIPPLVEVEPVVAAFEEMRVLGPTEDEEEPAAGVEVEVEAAADADADVEVDAGTDTDAADEADADAPDDAADEAHADQEPEVGADTTDEEPAEPAADEIAEGEVLPLFDRLRAEPEPEPEPPLPDLIEAEPDAQAEDEPDPVAVLADDLSRRLRRALADEQNQVLDRLRQDRKGQMGPDDLLAGDDARVVRLATVIEPRLRETPSAAAAPDLAARLAGQVADGVRAEMKRQVGRGGRDDSVDLARPVREAFRAWRTDRILPLATEVAAEALQP
jgi:hypothetical protein